MRNLLKKEALQHEQNLSPVQNLNVYLSCCHLIHIHFLSGLRNDNYSDTWSLLIVMDVFIHPSIVNRGTPWTGRQSQSRWKYEICNTFKAIADLLFSQSMVLSMSLTVSLNQQWLHHERAEPIDCVFPPEDHTGLKDRLTCWSLDEEKNYCVLNGPWT